LLEAVLEKQPQNAEALTFLGDASKAEKDFAGARNRYRQALVANPNYMPAMVGLGDLDWESGDKAKASRIYRSLTERYAAATLPARVKERLNAFGAEAAAAAARSEREDSK
jgi:Flp pilus assembly protein TadD